MGSDMQRASKIGWHKYAENVRTTTATSAGLTIKIMIIEYRKAGRRPQNLCNGENESIKYAYSDPDRGTIVPSSA